MSKAPSVAVSHIEEYVTEEIKEALSLHFSLLGITKERLSGKKIVIKPNLVMKVSPEAAATTHPAVVRALVLLLAELGAEHPIVAESPGGPYFAARTEQFYRICGLEAALKDTGAVLNTDPAETEFLCPEGKLQKAFPVLLPVAEADVIFNLCKLKTHSLTGMSGAVKNLFGTVPGLRKFELHAAYPESASFEEMLVDLCDAHCRRKDVISVCDAITGMEGNGPTGGSPKKFGALLTSESPFALDLAAEAMLGFEGCIGTVEAARRRGLIPPSSDSLFYPLLTPKDIVFGKVVPADSRGSASVHALRFFSGGKLGRFFAPRPKVNPAVCRGCGECKNSCPKHTIEMVQTGQKKTARINPEKCIRCFCCQELCPFTAIDTKRNAVLKLITLIQKHIR